MTGASKILTVSYGTFSCTLEGFDDPFNTMKAIAEYFRDLAADDRYFGAEPPTPDAAMLHRIAEREIHRRVEAKIQENGVILRAGDAEEAPAPAPRPSLAPAAPAAAESVAEKLQRIRAKHAPAKPAAPVAAVTAAAATAVADDYSEDEHAEDLPGPVAEPAPAAAPVVTASEIPAELDAILNEAEAHVAEVAPQADLALPGDAVAEAMEDLAEEEDEDDGLELNLDLAEDFADLPEAEDFDAEALAEEPANTVIIEDPVDDDALLSGLSDVLAADPLPEEAAPVTAEALPEEFDEEEDEDALLSSLIAETAAPAAVQAPAVATAPAGEDDMLARLGTLIDPEDEDDEAEFAAPIAAATIDEAEIVAETPASDEDAALAAIAAAAEPVEEPAPAPQRARARVIRIRRVEPAPVTDAEVIDAPAAKNAASALSAEDEAALQAELAALEAELAPASPVAMAPAAPAVADEDDEDEAPEAAMPEAVAPVRPSRPAAPQAPAAPAAEDAVGRLMAQADDAMGDDENRRRQSAIAHLKAAVAATTADRNLIEKSAREQATKMDAYREDLERVVRPRRPVAEGATPRPAQAPAEAANRPTPLVLVSEQRIDRPKPAETPAPAPAAEAPRPVMPVRPRRVSAVAEAAAPARPSMTLAAAPSAAPAPTPRPEVAAAPALPVRPALEAEDDLMPGEEEANVFAEGTSFAEFAEQLGASELPDLLEAAAVYCAEVLQRPEFSRPLVMRQVVGVADGDTSREDCLRGFGTLLRQGRIAKVKRGMFALTDRSPYLAEARKIAG